MLEISRKQREKLYTAVKDAYPQEGCGVLFGENLDNGVCRVKEIYVTKNVSDQKQDSFQIKTDQLLYAELFAAKKGYEIVGFYHSHPDGIAEFSDEDEKYMIPGMSYLIAAVTRENVSDLKSFCKILSAHQKEEIEEELINLTKELEDE